MRLRSSIACLALLGLAGAGAAEDKEKAKEGPKNPKAALIKVLVPGGNAQVTLKIEGNDTKQTGEERSFETPDLEPGKTYQYKLEALIVPNNYTKITRTREINFKAGETVTV